MMLHMRRLLLRGFAWAFLTPFVAVAVEPGPLDPQSLRDTLVTKTAGFLEGIGLKTAGREPPPAVDIAGDIIKTFLGFLGIVFVVLIIWAGWQWMTARGDDEQVHKATLQIVHAVIGLLIILSAYAATFIIFDVLLGATGQPTIL